MKAATPARRLLGRLKGQHLALITPLNISDSNSHSQRKSMYHPQHEPAEYDSTQLLSIQSLGLLLCLLCQENLTLPEGFRQSILQAWWEALQNWVAGPVHVFQPGLRGRSTMHCWQRQLSCQSLCWKLWSARLKKVDIKVNSTSRLFGVCLHITHFVKYNTVHTSTYQYIHVCTCLYHVQASTDQYILVYTNIMIKGKNLLPRFVMSLNVY